MARTVLGRGLSALIPNKNPNSEINFQQISVELLSPNPNQPRQFVEDESFQDLVGSVKQHGVLQPLIVKEKNGGFEIIAGERRYRAAISVGMAKIPAVVKNVRDEVLGFELALIENIQRQDLSPLEEARAYRYLLDDCRISQEKLARQIGKSRGYIANLVRLLNLDEAVQHLIQKGKLTAGHARPLVTLPPEEQKKLAQRIISGNLSVRQVEAIVSQRDLANKPRQTKNLDDWQLLEQQLSQKLQTKARIKSYNNKGRIEIYFSSYKELSKLKKKLL